MIIFAADNHYGVNPGLHAYEVLKKDYPTMVFAEDDWSIFTKYDLAKDCELLILNMIASTCNIPEPNEEQSEAVLNYCKTGKPLLLLHGASSAFWHHSWWRVNCGLRWVRPNDPDEVPASTHPKEPFVIAPSKTRHELCKQLVTMDLPQDEIYTELEQTCSLWTLMETNICNRTFPQCTESKNEWGGTVINFLPGHNPEVTSSEVYNKNVKILIDYLTK